MARRRGRALRKDRRKLGELEQLQEKLHADGRYAVLVVLQGRDASGKDGTIRKVFAGCNPQSCSVTSFVVPTPVERRHDFLWRVHAAVPPRGTLGIFNRSHYEDVIVPRVHGTVGTPIINSRYDQINDFERMLVGNNVIVLKFFLHVSRAEQRRRLLKRVLEHEKNWKFQEGDLGERQALGGLHGGVSRRDQALLDARSAVVHRALPTTRRRATISYSERSCVN